MTKTVKKRRPSASRVRWKPTGNAFLRIPFELCAGIEYGTTAVPREWTTYGGMENGADIAVFSVRKPLFLL